MGFFGNLFGGKDEEGDKRVLLDHPSKLRTGDILKIGFVDQPDISNKNLEVLEVNTYDFEGKNDYSLTLKSETGDSFWLSVTKDDGEEYINISKKLSRGNVKKLFNPDEFAKIFEEGHIDELLRVGCPEGFEEWTAESYYEEEDCSKGYFHRGDYRDKENPIYEDESTSLDYYLLEDEEGDFAIEIEVYEGGETEVYSCVYLPLSVISEMWPGEGKV